MKENTKVDGKWFKPNGAPHLDFDKFEQDMDTASIDTQEYHGRWFYAGPAAGTSEGDSERNRVAVIRATDVDLQWDNLGLDWIVYPIDHM